MVLYESPLPFSREVCQVCDLVAFAEREGTEDAVPLETDCLPHEMFMEAIPHDMVSREGSTHPGSATEPSNDVQFQFLMYPFAFIKRVPVLSLHEK